MSIEIPEQVIQWKFGGKAGNVTSQNAYNSKKLDGYSLASRRNDEYLTWVDGQVGVDLGYRNVAETKFHIRLPDGAERQVLTGEPFALAIGGDPAFLRYGEQEYGINLGFVKAPVFEWRLFLRGGEKGLPIPSGEWVAIINEKVEPEADFLVWLDRTVGGNIGWTTSPSFWNFLDPEELVKKAVGLARKQLDL